jgi:hypothetical protein
MCLTSEWTGLSVNKNLIWLHLTKGRADYVVGRVLSPTGTVYCGEVREECPVCVCRESAAVEETSSLRTAKKIRRE